jgi:iron complex transport system substrate-binding protein
MADARVSRISRRGVLAQRGAAVLGAVLSWENIDKYGADVIMLDSRAQALQPKDLAAGKPSWRRLPAVKAGQVIAWQPEPRFSYAGCAPILETLARTIRSSRKVAG